MAGDLTLIHRTYTVEANAESLNRLMVAIVDYAKTVCRKRGLSAADVDEIAQDVAIGVWTELSEFDRERSQFKTWVHWKIRTEVTRRRRVTEQHAKNVRAQASYLPETRPPDTRLIRTIREAAGKNARMVDLITIHGDVATVATLMGITPKAVRRRLEKLKLKFEARGENCPG